MIGRASLQVFADYHQFYVQDGGIDPAAPEDWTEEDIARRAKVAENVVVVCPLRNMTVAVELEVYEQEPSIQWSKWDHAVICDLKLPTGRLQVHECTGGELLNWQVAPAQYRVALLFEGLATISQDGLEGSDRYYVLLWPGNEQDLSVIQEWQPE